MVSQSLLVSIDNNITVLMINVGHPVCKANSQQCLSRTPVLCLHTCYYIHRCHRCNYSHSNTCMHFHSTVDLLYYWCYECPSKVELSLDGCLDCLNAVVHLLLGELWSLLIVSSSWTEVNKRLASALWGCTYEPSTGASTFKHMSIFFLMYYFCL